MKTYFSTQHKTKPTLNCTTANQAQPCYNKWLDAMKTMHFDTLSLTRSRPSMAMNSGICSFWTAFCRADAIILTRLSDEPIEKANIGSWTPFEIQHRWDFCVRLKHRLYWIFDGVTMTFNILTLFFWETQWTFQKYPFDREITSFDCLFNGIAWTASNQIPFAVNEMIFRFFHCHSWNGDRLLLLERPSVFLDFSPENHVKYHKYLPPVWMRNGAQDKKKTYWKIVSQHISIVTQRNDCDTTTTVTATRQHSFHVNEKSCQIFE